MTASVSRIPNCNCMRIRGLKPHRKLLNTGEVSKIKISEGKVAATSAKQKIAELLLENCSDCSRMAAIPQGAFAACKVRRNLKRNSMITSMEDREKTGKESKFNMRPPLEGWELTPLKYNSKLMNSIWGLYNRYSVHNFKKNTDSNDGVFGSFVAAWKTISDCHVPATNSVTAAAVTKNNS